MRRLLLPTLLLAACVVRGGGARDGLSPAVPQPPPADFEEVLTRLEALLDSPMDVDQRDRLLNARSLARQMKTAPPDVQQEVLGYLREVVAIEERARPIELPEANSDEMSVFSALGSPIVEEEIEELEVAPSTEGSAMGPSTATVGAPVVVGEAERSEESAAEVAPVAQGGAAVAALATARASLDAGKPAAALAALEPCRAAPCWEDAEPLWAAARDAYVGEERDRAGALWRAAGRESDPAARAEVLREARAILAALVDRFPDTAHAADIRRNIEQVQAELGTMERAAPADGGQAVEGADSGTGD